MKTILKETPVFYEIPRAREIARELQRHDDEWVFIVQETPCGKWAQIAVYDETGEFVEFWGFQS